MTHKATTFSFILNNPIKDRSERPSLSGTAGMAFNLHAATGHTARHFFASVERFTEALRGRVEKFVKRQYNPPPARRPQEGEEGALLCHSCVGMLAGNWIDVFSRFPKYSRFPKLACMLIP